MAEKFARSSRDSAFVVVTALLFAAAPNAWAMADKHRSGRLGGIADECMPPPANTTANPELYRATGRGLTENNSSDGEDVIEASANSVGKEKERGWLHITESLQESRLSSEVSRALTWPVHHTRNELDQVA
jgi:hypothetical protein